MKGEIEVNKCITYSTNLTRQIQPLKVVNKSDRIYVFKIRTNQKNVISLSLTNGFIKPHATLEVPIKLIDKPSEAIPLKLEINYTLATQQQFNTHDSKAVISSKRQLSKQVIVLLPESNKPYPQNERSDRSVSQLSKSGKIDKHRALQKIQQVSEDRKDQFKTVQIQISPFQGHPITPEHQSTSNGENQQNLKVPHGLFKHTFSTQKISIESVGNEQQPLFKMNLFQNQIKKRQQIVSKREQQNANKEVANPFSFLLQNNVKSNGSPHSSIQLENKQQKIKMTSSYKQPSKFTQKQIPLSDGNLSRQRQQELIELKTKIECYKSFIKELQEISIPQRPKQYSKIIFALFSIILFAIGALTKEYLA